MAVKDIINAGIGFAPGSLMYVITRGLEMGAVVIPAHDRRALSAIHRQADISKIIIQPDIPKITSTSIIPIVVRD